MRMKVPSSESKQQFEFKFWFDVIESSMIPTLVHCSLPSHIKIFIIFSILEFYRKSTTLNWMIFNVNWRQSIRFQIRCVIKSDPGNKFSTGPLSGTGGNGDIISHAEEWKGCCVCATALQTSQTYVDCGPRKDLVHYFCARRNHRRLWTVQLRGRSSAGLSCTLSDPFGSVLLWN